MSDWLRPDEQLDLTWPQSIRAIFCHWEIHELNILLLAVPSSGLLEERNCQSLDHSLMLSEDAWMSGYGPVHCQPESVRLIGYPPMRLGNLCTLW